MSCDVGGPAIYKMHTEHFFISSTIVKWLHCYKVVVNNKSKGEKCKYKFIAIITFNHCRQCRTDEKTGNDERRTRKNQRFPTSWIYPYNSYFCCNAQIRVCRRCTKLVITTRSVLFLLLTSALRTWLRVIDLYAVCTYTCVYVCEVTQNVISYA